MEADHHFSPGRAVELGDVRQRRRRQLLGLPICTPIAVL